MREAQHIEPAFRDGPAVDGDAVMTLVEGKARVPDQLAGNDHLADLAADVRDRRGAMHDPTQNISFFQVIVLGRNVGHDVRQAQAGPVQTGECGFQRRPIGNAEKLVAVEGNDEVPGIVVKRMPDEPCHRCALIEDATVFAAEQHRQTFVRQVTQNDWRRVGAAMVQDVKAIEKRRVVADERFDDVALVANRGDCGETHFSNGCWRRQLRPPFPAAPDLDRYAHAPPKNRSTTA